MMRTVALCTVLLFGTLSGLGQGDHEPKTFFKQHMGLQDDQIADIQHGKAVTKVLSTSTPAEVVVFGAVYINGSVEDYLKAAQNVNSLRGSPGYLGVQRFSTPPVLSDLKGFVLEEEDIKDRSFQDSLFARDFAHAHKERYWKAATKLPAASKKG